jgi:triosephosphate isomerase (TIM)
VQPRIVVNAKVYAQATGQAMVRLADACEAVAEEAGVPIGLAPPQVELAYLARRTDWPHVRFFGQHCDALEPGAGTGWITAESMHAAGAIGCLINHAEHKVPHPDVAAVVARLAGVGLESLVCADSMAETRALAPLAPTYLAVEPPELIGGNTSVTDADPAIVRGAAEQVRRLSPTTRTLCGAGVKTGPA